MSNSAYERTIQSDAKDGRALGGRTGQNGGSFGDTLSKALTNPIRLDSGIGGRLGVSVAGNPEGHYRILASLPEGTRLAGD